MARARMIERIGNSSIGIDKRAIEVEDQTVRSDDYSCSGVTIARGERNPTVAAWRLRLKRP